jgi:hypothetical protein
VTERAIGVLVLAPAALDVYWSLSTRIEMDPMVCEGGQDRVGRPGRQGVMFLVMIQFSAGPRG